MRRWQYFPGILREEKSDWPMEPRPIHRDGSFTTWIGRRSGIWTSIRRHGGFPGRRTASYGETKQSIQPKRSVLAAGAHARAAADGSRERKSFAEILKDRPIKAFTGCPEQDFIPGESMERRQAGFGLDARPAALPIQTALSRRRTRLGTLRLRPTGTTPPPCPAGC